MNISTELEILVKKIGAMERIVVHLIEKWFEQSIYHLPFVEREKLKLVVKFDLTNREACETPDEFQELVLTLWAPANYVYLVSEVVDSRRKPHPGGIEVTSRKTELLCCHDSCWRDSLFWCITNNRDAIVNDLNWVFGNWGVLPASDEDKAKFRKLCKMRDGGDKPVIVEQFNDAGR